MKLEILFKDGRKETFDSVESFNIIREQINLAQIPTEGKLFEVIPQAIERSLFKHKREDQVQERVRLIIQDAFDEIDKQSEEYTSPFYTLIPEKNWSGAQTVAALEEYANNLGGHMADWVEQAMEWAQRIFNGESWEAICTNPDTVNWYRLIVWKNGNYRIVGGSSYNIDYNPAVDVSNSDVYSHSEVDFTVPLVVIKKK